MDARRHLDTHWRWANIIIDRRTNRKLTRDSREDATGEPKRSAAIACRGGSAEAMDTASKPYCRIPGGVGRQSTNSSISSSNVNYILCPVAARNLLRAPRISEFFASEYLVNNVATSPNRDRRTERIYHAHSTTMRGARVSSWPPPASIRRWRTRFCCRLVEGQGEATFVGHTARGAIQEPFILACQVIARYGASEAIRHARLAETGCRVAGSRHNNTDAGTG